MMESSPDHGLGEEEEEEGMRVMRSRFEESIGTNALPREVLRWIQGLDLSFAVKNVKRDFANGFLISEILARYCEGVRIHSYTNKLSLSAKKDNWFLLNKLFEKYGIDCSPNTVNDIIYCKNGAASSFLQYLYTTLTGRKISKAMQGRSSMKIPPFARETAASLIKHKLKQPDMIIMKDSKQRQGTIRAVLEQHNSSLLEEKRIARISQERSVISNQNSSSGSSSRAPNSLTFSSTGPHGSKTSELEEKSNGSRAIDSTMIPGIVVKEVQVKQLNSNVAALRAKRSQNGANAVSVGSSISRDLGFDRTERQNSSIIELINSVIRLKFATRFDGESNKKQDPIFVLVSEIEKQRVGIRGEFVSEEELVILFEDIASSLENHDHKVAITEFWSLAGVLINVLEVIDDPNSDCFEACREVLIQYGQLLTRNVALHQILSSKRDLLDLFFEAAWPRLVPMVKNDPAKRRAALLVLCSFAQVDAESRIYVIKRLHQSLNDVGAFLHCLTILIFMEHDLGTQGSGLALLDLYAYYSLIGIARPEPSLRATSLAMLAVVFEHDPLSVARILPKLKQLASDEWWEVKCQLIIVLSKVLELEEGVEEEIVESTLEMILDVLDGASEQILKVGLVYLGGHVSKDARLLRAYLCILTGLTQSSSIGKLLDSDFNESEKLPLQSACGGTYHLAPLRLSWDSQAIAQELFNTVEGSKHLDPWHLQIVLALSLPSPNDEENGSTTSGQEAKIQENYVFDTFKDWVFVGLCNETTFTPSLSIIKSWVSQRFPIFEDRSFYVCLKMLFGNLSESFVQDQQKMADFLIELISNPSSPFHSTAAGLISELVSQYPELLENEVLCQIESHLL